MKPLPAVLMLLVGVALGVGIGLMLASQPADDQALEHAQKELSALRLELDGLKRQAAYTSVVEPGSQAPTLSRDELRLFDTQMDGLSLIHI